MLARQIARLRTGIVLAQNRDDLLFRELSDTFFVAASDEDNVLRVYAREKPGAPQRFDLNSFET